MSDTRTLHFVVEFPTNNPSDAQVHERLSKELRLQFGRDVNVYPVVDVQTESSAASWRTQFKRAFTMGIKS